MKRLRKLFLSLAAVFGVFLQFASFGGSAALAREMELWAYPMLFGLGMFQVGVVFVVLSPALDKHAAVIPWLRSLLSWLRAKMTIDASRFKQGFWHHVHRRGACMLATVATLLLGPIVGALIIRGFGTEERKAWRIAFQANVISVSIVASLYLSDMLLNLLRTGSLH